MPPGMNLAEDRKFGFLRLQRPGPVQQENIETTAPSSKGFVSGES
jgi:hypothetical protein